MAEREAPPILGTFWRLAASTAAILFMASPAAAQQAPSWPEHWLAAGLEFGKLSVAYRLTDDCEIDPDFEITESPNLDVTREEILGSLTGFLAAGTRHDPPREVMFKVMREVLGPDRDPNQSLTQTEYETLVAEIEKLGPWPTVRLAPVSRDTYRCTFDTSGALIRVERSVSGESPFSDLAGNLSEEGPFFLSWYIEE